MKSFAVLILLYGFFVTQSSHAQEALWLRPYSCSAGLEKLAKLTHSSEDESAEGDPATSKNDGNLNRFVGDMAEIAIMHTPLLLTPLHHEVAFKALRFNPKTIFLDNLRAHFGVQSEAKKEVIVSRMYELLLNAYRPFFDKTDLRAYSYDERLELQKFADKLGVSPDEALQSAQLFKNIHENTLARLGFLRLLNTTFNSLQELSQPRSRQQLYQAYMVAKTNPDSKLLLRNLRIESYDLGYVTLLKTYDANAEVLQKIEIVKLVTEEYPLLFQKPYFVAFDEVLREKKTNYDRLTNKLEINLNGEMDSVSSSIWDRLVIKYKLGFTSEFGQTPANFEQTALVIKTLDQNPVTKALMIKMIRESLKVMTKSGVLSVNKKSGHDFAAWATVASGAFVGFGGVIGSAVYAALHPGQNTVIAPLLDMGGILTMGAFSVGSLPMKNKIVNGLNRFNNYRIERKKKKAVKIAGKVAKKFSGQYNDSEEE